MRKPIDANLVKRLHAEGQSYGAIAKQLGASKSTIARLVRGVPEEVRRDNAVRAAEWNRANLERRREISRDSARRYRARIRAQVLEAYGGKCACCGDENEVFLTIDHINGDGAEHRRALGGRTRANRVYLWLIDHGFPQEGFRILCRNCQEAYYRLGTCPHQAVV